MKRILIILILAVLIVLALFYKFFSGENISNEPDGYYGDFPKQSELIEKISREAGEKFISSTLVENIGSNLYSMERTLNESDAGFSILYDRNKGVFYIAITKSPVTQYQTNATNYFVNLLKLSKEKACQLQVYVADLSNDNNAQTGNLGLTICD